jgi:hypothetical protein
MDSNYIAHNAKEAVGVDTWLVIDRSSGTAVSQREAEGEARQDADIANAFYDRWPSVPPIGDVSTQPDGVSEDGKLLSRMSPLLSRGFWADHDFG